MAGVIEADRRVIATVGPARHVRSGTARASLARGLRRARLEVDLTLHGRHVVEHLRGTDELPAHEPPGLLLREVWEEVARRPALGDELHLHPEPEAERLADHPAADHEGPRRAGRDEPEHRLDLGARHPDADVLADDSHGLLPFPLEQWSDGVERLFHPQF